MERSFIPWREIFGGGSPIKRLHQLLWIYNGVVVVLLAGFYFVTQQKIIEAMAAHAFLETLPIVPLPAEQGLMFSIGAFLVLFVCGRLYHHGGLSQGARYFALAVETAACIVVMRSLSLAYDGLVLLVVADLMHRYDGHNIGSLLVSAMLVLYFLADYNLIVFHGAVAPFDSYAAYYNSSVRSWLLAIKNGFSSVNLVLFALYLAMLIQSKHQEKERIQSLNDQLEKANRQLRLYAIEAERTAETRERNRQAREIHDNLGHTLTGLATGMDACLVLIDAAPQEARKQLSKLCQVARHGLKDVRRSVKKLRPDDLERMPLREAITHVVQEFGETTGMAVKLSIEGWPEHLREDVEEVLYRIVQEGLTNAKRHGHAQHASVAFRFEQGRLSLVIADDGEGCPDVSPGFGLRHMKERLDLLHGSLRCWSDNGFTLEAIVPVGQIAGADGAREEKQ